jgi:hypothetical protein
MKNKVFILHPAICPKCGYPSHADNHGRMMCCEGVRIRDDSAKFKRRRPKSEIKAESV